MSRFWYLQGALALVLVLEPACRKRQVAVPVPPQPAAASQPQAAEPPATPSQTSATPQPGAATTNNTQQSPYQVNRPAQPSPTAAPKSSRPAAPPSPQATPATPPASATAPVQPPQLGDIVTPDQQRQYNAAIDQSLSRAQASLTSLANRALNKDQQGLVEQIRNIMQQAQASRSSDLPGAKSLAARAEVLAKDLAGSFR